MSNLVLPTLPGRSAERTRAPVHATHVAESVAGVEYRWRKYTSPRWQYRQSYNFLRQGRFTTDELETLVGFYNAHGGRADSWLYNDPEDNTATAAPFGAGDSTTTQFQLVRALGGYAQPVHAVQGIALISIDGVAQSNLLTNSSFEVDANANGVADGWQAYSNGSTGTVTHAISVDSVTSGSKSQQVQATALAAGDTNRIGISRSVLGAFAGLTLAAGVDVLASAGAKVRLYAEWHAGAAVLGSFGQEITATGATQRLAASQVAPAGADRLDFYVWVSNGSGGAAVIYIDSAFLGLGTATAYVAAEAPAVSATAGVTFATAPASGALLTWSGNFYWRCRFLEDQVSFKRLVQGLWQAGAWDFITCGARG